MRLLLLLSALSWQAAAAAPGEAVVTDVSVTGARARSSRSLLDLLATRPGRPFSASRLQSDCAALTERYRADGYYAAMVRVDTLLYAPDSLGVEVRLAVAEGDRYLVGSVRIDGAAPVPEAELLAGLGTVPGSLLDRALLEEDIAKILAECGRLGHPFAALRVAGIDTRPDTALLDVRLALEEGPMVTLRDVRIEGNSSTNPEVLLREMRLRLPEPYDEERVARIAPRLRRLGLFAAVRDPELRMTDSGGVLLLRVEEGRTSTFDGVLGYAPAASGQGDGVLAGLVSLDLRNLFGTARAFALRWQRDGRSSQEIRLQYVEPWLFGAPVNAGGGFEQRQQDSSYVRRAVSAKADLLLSEAFSLSGSLRHDVTIPSAGAGPRPVESSRTLTAGLEILYDSRNDALSPTAGILYRNEYRIGDKKTFGGSAAALEGPSAFQQVTLDLQWFVQPMTRSVVMAGLHGRQVTTSHLEPSDLFRFGGTNSVRGFRELQFSGSRVAWTNLEYRVLLATRSFAYGFFDSGYYALPADAKAETGSSQSVTYGYGVGLRTETSLGNVGVSVALGEGDPFSQAKVHVGLVNEF
jgi:outer membrane protein insertion porin family